MALYPNQFNPLAPNDLVRIGSAMDGGYVIPERILASSMALLSFGLSDEWEFEEQFFSHTNKPVACFDHTVNGAFWVRKIVANLVKGILQLSLNRLRRSVRFFSYRQFFDGRKRKHIKRPIGYSSIGGLSVMEATRLSNFHNDIFLKMDIEGWEYRVLDELIENRSSFTGFAIEFHDVDLHSQRICEFIEEINDSFVLVHFHPNTHTQIGHDGFALVVEMTFMNRNLLHKDETLMHKDLPLPDLDAPNLPGNIHKPINFVST